MRKKHFLVLAIPAFALWIMALSLITQDVFSLPAVSLGPLSSVENIGPKKRYEPAIPPTPEESALATKYRDLRGYVLEAYRDIIRTQERALTPQEKDERTTKLLVLDTLYWDERRDLDTKNPDSSLTAAEFNELVNTIRGIYNASGQIGIGAPPDRDFKLDIDGPLRVNGGIKVNNEHLKGCVKLGLNQEGYLVCSDRKEGDVVSGGAAPGCPPPFVQVDHASKGWNQYLVYESCSIVGGQVRLTFPSICVGDPFKNCLLFSNFPHGSRADQTADFICHSLGAGAHTSFRTTERGEDNVQAYNWGRIKKRNYKIGQIGAEKITVSSLQLMKDAAGGIPNEIIRMVDCDPNTSINWTEFSEE